MTELLTAAQMRAIEMAAIESGDVTGLELMERAGRGVVEAVFEEWPELATTSFRAVVLCGPGNNGGDGFVVARLLKEQGWEVEVYLYGDAEKLPPDARVNYERWVIDGDVGDLDDLYYAHGWDSYTNFCFDEQEVYFFDAVFGIDLIRPLEEELASFLCDALNHSLGKYIAIDVPSGHCADSGRILEPDDGPSVGDARSCDLVVTFHRAKLGLVLEEGICDNIKLVDIGLNKFHWDTKWNNVILDKTVRSLGVKGPKDPSIPFAVSSGLNKFFGANKFDNGHVLVLTGGSGKTGAARLAARGALRIGAGVVTLGVPPSAQMEVAGHITAIMLTRVGDADALAEVLKDGRINALCLGPGLGLERARALVPVACGGVKPHPTVLDADALSAYADAPEVLFDMLHDKCVLTPHGGEFARLFPDIAKRFADKPISGPAYSKVDATRDAAKRAGCVVLYKGADTVIAAPDGHCSINSAHYDRAAPWLATAGSGDVLAGFITGLMARGFDPMQAAETAAWLHVECALEFGPGLIAEDIPETLPKVFRKLEL